MKKLQIILLGIFISGLTFGKPVDLELAKDVGHQFVVGHSGFRGEQELVLAYQSVSGYTNQHADLEPVVYFYVFNFDIGDGFVIVSGDDIVKPILGYSTENDFDPDNIPPQVVKWLEGYKDQIRYAMEAELQPTEEISRAWSDLLDKKDAESLYRGFRSVNPLMKTMGPKAILQCDVPV